MGRGMIALLLAGCVAEAAPPVVVGGGGGGGGGSTIYTDKTCAQCQAVSTFAAGTMCQPTDSAYTLIARTANVWSYRWPGVGFDVTPPPSAGWTSFNSGSVASSGCGERTLTIPAEAFAGNGYRGEYRAVPSDPTTTPYDVRLVTVDYAQGQANASYTGTTMAGFTDQTGLAYLARGGGTIFVARYSNYVTFVGFDVELTANHANSIQASLIGEDATNRHFSNIDAIGQEIEYGSGFNRTTTITATDIIWAGSNNDASGARSSILIDYTVDP